MIVEIEGRAYDGISIEDLSLRHTLALQRELAVTDISSAHTWAEVQALIREFASLSEADRLTHPEGVFLSAVVIWAARVSAGEDIGLLDAVDVPLSKIRFIQQPGDLGADDHRKPAAGKAQGRRGKKRRR